MDPVDEFDALAASICDEHADPDPDQSGAGVVLDESLLDMEDNEIQVLEPPLLPTPAEPLPASPTTAEHEKVNASIMSVDSRHSGVRIMPLVMKPEKPFAQATASTE